MSALKKEHHEYLVGCLDCERSVKRGERCRCGASSVLTEYVEESITTDRTIRPVIVRKKT